MNLKRIQIGALLMLTGIGILNGQLLAELFYSNIPILIIVSAFSTSALITLWLTICNLIDKINTLASK